MLNFSLAYAQNQCKPKVNKCTEKTTCNKNRPKFSPEEFIKKEDEFIIREAQLTPVEASQICPIVHEMNDEIRKKDRQIHQLVGNAMKQDVTDAQCHDAIDDLTDLSIEKINIKKRYHKKMLKILSAKKVVRVLNADERFGRFMLRQMFDNWNHKHWQPNQNFKNKNVK